MKYLFFLHILLNLINLDNKLLAQDFLNNDLDGDIISVNLGSSSLLPTNWQSVPFNDVNCQASIALAATPDLTTLYGCDTYLGIIGNPYSGNTFVSGIMGISTFSPNSPFFHEGIMQTVSGFNPGCSYNINFFQAVVKQLNYEDFSGSWAVYADNELIGISSPTFSNEPYNSTSFIWEFRSFSFIPSAETHTIKFLVMGDGNGIPNLRMGIDSIYITQNPSTINLGNDTTLCEGETLILDVTSSNSTYVWQDNSTNPTYIVNQTGTYWVEVTNNCGVEKDTIHINYDTSPTVNLANDTTLCQGETLILYPIVTNANAFLWQDNSSSSTYTATHEGVYWVEVSNFCGTQADTLIIEEENCMCSLYIPNTFTPNQDELNNQFLPVSECSFTEYHLMIFNRWGEMIFESFNPSFGWDGTYYGKISANGLYTYSVTYKYENEKIQTTHGHINLLR